MVQKLDNAKHFDVLMLMYNLIEYDKKYTKKTNPKITILEILVYKIQPEIMQSKTFTRLHRLQSLLLCFVLHIPNIFSLNLNYIITD